MGIPKAKICLGCGNPFTLPSKRSVRLSKQKYCSRACGGSYPRPDKAVEITKICECCKLPYVVYSDPSHQSRQNKLRRFCSIRCQRSSRAVLRIFYRPQYKYEGFIGRNGVFVPWH